MTTRRHASAWSSTPAASFGFADRRRTCGRGPTARSKAGVTLLEILVVAPLVMLLLGAFLLSQMTGYGTYAFNEAYVQVQQEARRAIQTMVAELREAGHVNVGGGSQRLDFQVIRRYEAGVGQVWGSDADDGAWVHYQVDTASLATARVVRYTTANRDDPMPAGCAGCRVLANDVDPAPANTAFTYSAAPQYAVTLRIRSVMVSRWLPGGQVGTGTDPLSVRVRLRNAS